MSRTRDRTAEGAALLFVLIAAVIVFAALGSVVAGLRWAAIGQRQATGKAQARALALGAWNAAAEGLAREGDGFEGVAETALGRGFVEARVERIGDGLYRVLATGRVPGARHAVHARVEGTIRLVRDGADAESSVEVVVRRVD